MKEKKILNLAFIAHDARKDDLITWAHFNRKILSTHHIYATGTTGKLLKEKCPGLQVTTMQSGPLGGDQEIGSMISRGKIDGLFFFWDPMTPHPHDPDVKALIRLAVVKNIIIVEDRYTADLVITSSLFANPEYKPIKKDYTAYLKRPL